ncbi:MAG TPA: hypothetical protein VJV79_13505 [Polyangiaceae bacterium]|nr:hypothetical protein [Polyangiaceae bacterium]
MKFGAFILALVPVVAYAGSGWAATPERHTGFQMALRTGLSIPFGEAVKNENLNDLSSIQVPLVVDIGGKPIPELFLGGYLGLGYGGPSGALREWCSTESTSCTSVDLRFGVQAQYHFLPGGAVNPWLGYGIGYESLAVSRNTGRSSGSLDLGGLEFAHFMGGADFRISRVFGLGPFIDLSLGKFSSISNDTSFSSTSGAAQHSTHGWLMLGARFVFLP